MNRIQGKVESGHLGKKVRVVLWRKLSAINLYGFDTTT